MNVYYYNAYITYNGNKTSIPFSRLLDEIIILDPSQKFKNTRHGEYSLLKMRLPIENRDVNDRSICIADYRARKPKLGEKRSNRLDDIPDDVIESTNCFYQHNNKLLIVEYNHHGAKAKHIETYLESFLPNIENHQWGVEIIEIDAPIGLSDVLASNDIRYLDIKLDLSSNQRRQIANSEDSDSITMNIFSNIVNAQSQIGGNTAQIYFGNGRKRSNPLNPEEIKKILRVLALDSDLYISIKVKYNSRLLGRVHELDIKNASVLKQDIQLDGDAWETIADSIEEYFYDYGRIGQNTHQRFEPELIVADFPGIITLELEE